MSRLKRREQLVWAENRMHLANDRVIAQKKMMEARGISVRKDITPRRPEQLKLAQLRRWRDIHALVWVFYMVMFGKRDVEPELAETETVIGN